MMGRLPADAVVEAECTGRGPLPWMLVFISAESAAVIARTTPMFRTRAAAMSAGNQLLLSRHEHDGKVALSLV